MSIIIGSGHIRSATTTTAEVNGGGGRQQRRVDGGMIVGPPRPPPYHHQLQGVAFPTTANLDGEHSRVPKFVDAVSSNSPANFDVGGRENHQRPSGVNRNVSEIGQSLTTSSTAAINSLQQHTTNNQSNTPIGHQRIRIEEKYFTSDECASQAEASSSSEHDSNSSAQRTVNSNTPFFKSRKGQPTRSTGTSPVPPVPLSGCASPEDSEECQCAITEYWWALDNNMRKLASYLGLWIGKYPLVFLIVPLILTCLAIGPFIDGLSVFLKNSKQGNVQLFLPDNLKSTEVKNRLSSMFPDGGYFANRDFLANNLLIAIVSSKQQLSVFHPVFVREYAKLRALLDNTPYKLDHPDLDILEGNNTHKTYASVCATHTRTHCRPDAFLALWHAMSVARDSAGLIAPPRLTFPVIQIGGRGIYVGSLFGDVTLNEQGALVHATYVRMIFDLPPELGDNQMTKYGDVWVDALRSLNSSLIDVVFWNPLHYQLDLAETGQRSRRWLPLLAVVLVLFSAISCCMCDLILSKPWLAVGGVMSAGCGILCSQALLHLMGIELIQIAMIVPFLVLSIGVDDTFVILNVWRKSRRDLGVAERLRDTYSESAVSISITTLTDASVFGIGIFSSFPAIRTFCSYCCLAIILVFVFQLIMFGALLSLSGHREHAHRHSITLLKVPKGPMPPALCGLTRFLSTRPWQNVYFGVWHTRLLQNLYVQAVIWISYVAYIVFSTYSITQLQIGLQTYHLVPYDTDTYAYSVLYDQYFTRYNTAAEFAITGEIDIYDLRTRYEILDMIGLVEHTDHTLPATHFWMRDFLLHLEQVQVTDSNEFYDLLANQFLKQPAYRHYQEDVVIEATSGDSNRRYVRHMRAFIPLIYMDTHNRSHVMHLLNSLVLDINKHHPKYSCLVYDVSFPLAEQYDAIGHSMLVNMLVAGACMLVIALLFIPNIVCCVAVSVTVISINAGVLGFLCVFGVSLDIVSNITILLSIGFSVDFSSHVAYHYHHAQGMDVQQRLSSTLETVGWPIMQSSLSTLFGVLTLSGIQSYISTTFVKTVVLVMLVGIYHGLFLLPLFLCTVEKFCCSRVLHASLRRKRTVKPVDPAQPQPQQQQPQAQQQQQQQQQSISISLQSPPSMKSQSTAVAQSTSSQQQQVKQPPEQQQQQQQQQQHTRLTDPGLSTPESDYYCIDTTDANVVYTSPYTPPKSRQSTMSTRPGTETMNEVNYAVTANEQFSFSKNRLERMLF